jgi:hypothetical protein
MSRTNLANGFHTTIITSSDITQLITEYFNYYLPRDAERLTFNGATLMFHALMENIRIPLVTDPAKKRRFLEYIETKKESGVRLHKFISHLEKHTKLVSMPMVPKIETIFESLFLDARNSHDSKDGFSMNCFQFRDVIDKLCWNLQLKPFTHEKMGEILDKCGARDWRETDLIQEETVIENIREFYVDLIEKQEALARLPNAAEFVKSQALVRISGPKLQNSMETGVPQCKFVD